MSYSYEGKEPYIFISYSVADRTKVSPIIDELQKKGYRIWYDAEIMPGDSWTDSIARHIKDCALCIAFISDSFARSEHCTAEIYYALRNERTVIPIYLSSKTELPIGLKMYLSRFQSIRLNDYSDIRTLVERMGHEPVFSRTISVAYSKGEIASSVDIPKSNSSVVRHFLSYATKVFSSLIGTLRNIFTISKLLSDSNKKNNMKTTQYIGVERECKVIFLGDGGVGKSSLIEKIINPKSELDNTLAPTNGIKISVLDTHFNGKTVRLRIMDFGGQEIMHSMHRCFLTAHTIYVIVCESRSDTDIDSMAARWIETVKSFAPDCPVILALNKADLNRNISVNETDLRNRNPSLKEVLKTSASLPFDHRFGASKLFASILENLSECINYVDANKNMLAIKWDLDCMSEDYIPAQRYQEICASHNVTNPEEQRYILDWLRNLGVAYFYESESQLNSAMTTVRVLNPSWLTNGIYRLILRTPPTGFLTHKEIKRTLGKVFPGDVRSNRYNEEEVLFILHVMHLFEISHDTGDGIEIIPMKMDKTPSRSADTFPRNTALHLRWESFYLPNNLVHKLVIRKIADLDKSCIWRTGALFHNKISKCSALVEMNEKALDMYVCGPNDAPRQYMENFRAEVQDILMEMNLEATEIICCWINGKEGKIPYKDVMKQYHDGKPEVYISNIQEYSSPSELLKTIYFDWEGKAQQYKEELDYTGGGNIKRSGLNNQHENKSNGENHNSGEAINNFLDAVIKIIKIIFMIVVSILVLMGVLNLTDIIKTIVS